MNSRLVHNACWLTVLLAAAATGCGTPMAVKRLSAEEVKAQVSYLGSLKAYFEVVSKFVDAQVQASDFRIDRLTRDIEQEFKSSAVAQLATAQDENARRKVLNDLATNIDNNQATASKQKQQFLPTVPRPSVCRWIRACEFYCV